MDFDRFGIHWQFPLRTVNPRLFYVKKQMKSSRLLLMELLNGLTLMKTDCSRWAQLAPCRLKSNSGSRKVKLTSMLALTRFIYTFYSLVLRSLFKEVTFLISVTLLNGSYWLVLIITFPVPKIPLNSRLLPTRIQMFKLCLLWKSLCLFFKLVTLVALFPSLVKYSFEFPILIILVRLFSCCYAPSHGSSVPRVLPSSKLFCWDCQ